MLRKVLSALLFVLLLFPFATIGFASGSYYDSFDSYDRSKWHKADGWSNEDMFNCTWRANNVNFSRGQISSPSYHAVPWWPRFFSQMELMISSPSNGKFDCGEYRTNDFFHYGLYEVRMKPAKNVGIISSFFTYTGPTEGKPWDEIDIEFLGKDTTKVQFNYFTNGVGDNEYLADLGFDASLSYNTYAFEWLPNAIKWYVNGELKHTATSNIPQTPGRIMVNLWNSIGVDEWTGPYDGRAPVKAYYDWVRYTPYTNSTPASTNRTTALTNSTPARDLQLRACDFSDSKGIINWNCGIGSFDPGDWIKFSNVDLSTGYNAFAVRHATPTRGSFDIRLGSPNGKTIGTVQYDPTGGWGNYQWNGTPSLDSSVKGKHDIFIVGKTGATNFSEIHFKNE